MLLVRIDTHFFCHVFLIIKGNHFAKNISDVMFDVSNSIGGKPICHKVFLEKNFLSCYTLVTLEEITVLYGRK